jgi:hypothetical protein
MYNVDRKTASKLLKVTTRTVDRWIASNRLSIEKRDGRIWLSRKELDEMRSRIKVDRESMSTPDLSMDKSVSTSVDMSIDAVHVMSDEEKLPKSPRAQNTYKGEDGVYKKLFEESQQELKVKQERLEGANYRVGQLEAMLKEAIPLLEHQKMVVQERNQKEQAQNAIIEMSANLNTTETKLKDEKLNRKVFMIFLFIIMLLQPLWLLLALKK